MEHRSLGRSGLSVSILGLGTGGANVFGASRGAGPDEARALVRAALDVGVDWFDTAQAYGDSERRLAGALAGVPRRDYVLATKYQPRMPDGELRTGTQVHDAIRSSLERLRTETIDVFYVHALQSDDYDRVAAEQMPVLVKAREEGLIRAIGVTESFAGDDPTHKTLERAVRDADVDVVMVGYNVLHQSAERDILPTARAADVGVVVMAAVRRALATRGALETLVADLKARGLLDREAIADTDPLGWLVDAGSPSVQAACYRYVTAHPAVSSVLTGTFDRDHLLENARAATMGPLRDEDRDRLRRIFGHLDLGLGR